MRVNDQRAPWGKCTLEKLVTAVFAEISHACVGNEDESVIVRFDCCADVKEPDPIGANGYQSHRQDAGCPNLWSFRLVSKIFGTMRCSARRAGNVGQRLASTSIFTSSTNQGRFQFQCPCEEVGIFHSPVLAQLACLTQTSSTSFCLQLARQPTVCVPWCAGADFARFRQAAGSGSGSWRVDASCP